MPDDADTIRTYFPPSVLYQGSGLSEVEVCQEVSGRDFVKIDGCVFDADSNMIEFMIPDHTGGWFVYDLGYMQNPPYEQQLDGFTLQVLDSAAPDVILDQNTAVSVRILAGALTE